MTRVFRPRRRDLLVGAGAAFGSAFLPKAASAAGARDPRLVVIILRGAMDGLGAVAPIGDPDYASLHGDLALRWDGERAALRINDFFGLNPAMTNFARLYDARQALVVHATANQYRDRSHFDGQDVLESGMPAPGMTQSGWLNRAADALPRGGAVRGGAALGVGVVPPLVIRGPAPILGWELSGLAPPTDDLLARVMNLYAHADPELAKGLSAGIDADRMAAGRGMDSLKPGRDVADQMKRSAAGAARLMAAEDGPRLTALAFDGWDTHVAEGGATGRLAQLLGGLDGAFAAFERELGAAWKQTIVIAITEFGRTARVNGTVGTDHGVAAAAFLAGGALAGGRVIADWPGLRTGDLYEGRDLRPTTDLRAVLKGVLADHLGLPAAILSSSVFPDTLGVKPMPGLIAS